MSESIAVEDKGFETAAAPSGVLLGFFFFSSLNVALALLLYRMLSVVASYHFAFLSVSVGMTGISIGAFTNFFASRLLSRNIRGSLFVATLLFAASTVILVWILSLYPISAPVPGEDYERIQFLQAFAVLSSIFAAFFFSGIFFSIVICEYASSAARVYSRYLFGAALGSMLIVPLQRWLPGAHAFFAVAFAASMVSLFFAPGRRSRLVSVAACILFAGLIASSFRSQLWGSIWVNEERVAPDTMSFWDAYSYVRLAQTESAKPTATTTGPRQVEEVRQMKVEEETLELDGVVRAVLSRFDGNLEKVRFLYYDLAALPYAVVKNGSVVAVGPGGNRDILTALYFKQREIYGIEGDDAYFSILQALQFGFASSLTEPPNVHWIKIDPRVFFSSTNQSFDLIRLSSTDDYAASLTRAQALKVNTTYTIQAFQAYLTHLKEDGVLSMSIWHGAGTAPRVYRIVSLVREAFRGLGSPEIQSHLIIVLKKDTRDSPGKAEVLVKRSPFRDDEIDSVVRFCDERGFDLYYEPHGGTPELAKVFDDNYFWKVKDQSVVDLDAPTDDRPFFHSMDHISWEQFRIAFTKRLDPVQAPFLAFSVAGILTTLGFFVPFLIPAAKPYYRGANTALLNLSGFIGFGSVFVVFATITRFQSFLGHPFYSFVVIFPGILLGAALGSFCTAFRPKNKELFPHFTVMSVCCAIFGVVIPIVLDLALNLGNSAKIALSLLLVCPLGYTLGTFVPMVLVRAQAEGRPTRLAWAWNQTMCIGALTGAQILLLTFGSLLTYFCGVVNIFGAVWRMRRLDEAARDGEVP